ncbi:glycosyltransferase family 4 protein [Arachidicoccus ginsenosidivorans]|uniref:Glycosyltransferase family 4 protein n=1 Tax=Arachidicoccus ginsenosidivorans TaxID=496057 RepID=A0A5B8VJP0_9BACT|nr:glycosyltransferase [Arachidicoccus ginsenosidivorans]QEC71787.1 glycosyltransferase family 4 protein [Arachidicoccus ginsenosidivorans]
MKKIIFSVTNDLVYDQRMQKICTSLATNGFDVMLVGFHKKNSKSLGQKKFKQHRLGLFSRKGPLFFIETNIRLFFYLVFHKADILVADDLDTALPVLFASVIRRSIRVFDAHELFCEMHDIISRPRIYKIWKAIERFCQPRFPLGYTENDGYAAAYQKMYGVNYFIVMNSPYLREVPATLQRDQHSLIYQGVVEKGRGFEGLVPAMQGVNAHVTVCGNGSYLGEVKAEIQKRNLTDKFDFKGFVLPEDLSKYTRQAYIGLNLNDNLGASFFLSLSNRFFDYMHAGIPQLTMNYPENKKINDLFEIGVLIDDLHPQTITQALNRLLTDNALYARLQANCLKAREIYNWNTEEKKLIHFYKGLKP